MQVTNNTFENAVGPGEWFTGAVYFEPDKDHWHGGAASMDET